MPDGRGERDGCPQADRDELGAGLPLAGLTAYQAVVHALRVQQDETLLVHGAAGGVGSLAAQIGRAGGDLVTDYPGIRSRDVALRVAAVLQETSIELGNGRPVPIGMRRAVRGLADALRREMQPR